ncbi:alkaline phosphatase family protein [Halonatronum saccharophilum]|uniref:alkaline phosphatase family protein n=1 Tax=Halonatronum saccharophilum TaxID=150060 RepID=UPI000480DF59|nr:alkaline phosphatase family protein [Halonatronum saccharophilum]
MKIRTLILSFILVIISSFVFIGITEAREDRGKYLVIHVDGISSELFLDELNAGELENLNSFFANGNIIDYGITYFPPFTQVVTTRIREGKKIYEGELIDWDRYDEETDEGHGKISVFMKMRDTVSRRARSNFAYGYPVLSYLGGPALLNVPDLIDKYGVVEFYWFATDTYGHAFGENQQRKWFRRFDKYFGEMASNLDDDVNVIIYSDHGMTFGERVDFEDEMEEIFKDDVLNFSYPNIYLANSDDKVKIAKKLLRETPLDYTFIQEKKNKIIGYHNESSIIFEIKNEKISYSYEGVDTFGYYEAGYKGQPLTEDQWLEFTHKLEYPLVPVNIYNLFKSPNVGDIISVLNAPKIMGDGYVRKGNHQGITSIDMTVPIFLKGPNLEHLYDYEYMRLDSLFSTKVTGVNFEDVEPKREKHSISLWVDDYKNPDLKARFSYSPKYRVQLGANISLDDIYDMWGEYDIYSGYLTRHWLGGGISYDDDLSTLIKFRSEIRVRRLALDYTIARGRDSKTNLSYRVSNNIDLNLLDFETFGLRYRW